MQAHFTNGIAIGFRTSEFVKNMGFQLKNDAESYSFKNFVKEMFFDSDTMMVVISGVPGRENQKDQDGNVLRDDALAQAVSAYTQHLVSIEHRLSPEVRALAKVVMARLRAESTPRPLRRPLPRSRSPTPRRARRARARRRAGAAAR